LNDELPFGETTATDDSSDERQLIGSTPARAVTEYGEDGICEFEQRGVIFGGQCHIVHQRHGFFNALPE
jgi:hypothetical protein